MINKKLKVFIGLSLLLNIILLCTTAILAFKFKREIFSKFASGRFHSIVLFGDSQIYNGSWGSLLGRSDIYNAGTPGFTTSHFVWRVNQDVIQQHPKVCFLEAGINDIGVGIPLSRTFKNFESIVDTLMAHNINPVLQSTFYNNIEEDSVTNHRVDTLNAYLKHFAKLRKISFIDLNPVLSKDRKLIKELTYDGVHLNDKGYELWALEISKYLKNKGL